MIYAISCLIHCFLLLYRCPLCFAQSLPFSLWLCHVIVFCLSCDVIVTQFAAKNLDVHCVLPVAFCVKWKAG